jgi:hypothetical protein
MARYIDFNKQSEAVQLAAHAVGLDHKRPYMRHGRIFYRPYRNYFTTHDRTHDHAVWKGLCESGHAKSCPNRTQGSFTFWLTRDGLDWLGETLGITIYDEER